MVSNQLYCKVLPIKHLLLLLNK